MNRGQCVRLFIYAANLSSIQAPDMFYWAHSGIISEYRSGSTVWVIMDIATKIKTICILFSCLKISRNNDHQILNEREKQQ